MTATSDARTSRATILIVDDTPENLRVLDGILAPHYRVRAANSGPRAIQIVTSSPPPDLVLLDIMMPEMDGHEVLRRIKAVPGCGDLPVMFVTALDDDADEEAGFALGAVDYITKPVRPAIVLARVRAQLELKRSRELLADQNVALEAEISRRMLENRIVQDVSIRALANLAETRDPETGDHIRRTQGYVETLALRMRAFSRHEALLGPRYVAMVTEAAPLHDIGKVGIPDEILHKPGRLTPAEFTRMKEHAAIGGRAIELAMRGAVTAADVEALRPAGTRQVLEAALRGDPGAPLAFLGIARQIAYHHHERWDGSGYPDGLAGTAIPLPARLMALADVFDALVSWRVYKKPTPFEESVRIILEGRGTHFDPDVVDAFVASLDEFRRISLRYDDSDPRSRREPYARPGLAAALPPGGQPRPERAR